jgi:hypothetical protein
MKTEQITVGLKIDASEALETLAKVKTELEEVLALEKEIAELKGKVSERLVRK